MMRDSTEPRDQIFVKKYGFLCFAKYTAKQCFKKSYSKCIRSNWQFDQ